MLVFVSICVYNNILRITICFYKNSTFQASDSRVDRMCHYVAPSSVLSVYCDKICIKFALHHLLLYVVYMCQKSLNFTYAFKCYQQNASGFTLAGPPCIGPIQIGPTCRPAKMFSPACRRHKKTSGANMCGLRTRALANADPQNFFWNRGLTADPVP